MNLTDEALERLAESSKAEDESERLREEVRRLREMLAVKDSDFRRIVAHYLPTELAHSVAASALALRNP